MGEDVAMPPASILTNAQRKWMLEEKEYRPSTEREVRRRIRERIACGIRDIGLIVDNERFGRGDIEAAVTVNADDVQDAIRANGAEQSNDENLNGWRYRGDPSDVVAFATLLEFLSNGGWDQADAMIVRGVRAAFSMLDMSWQDISANIEPGDEFDDLLEEDLADLPEGVMEQLLIAGKISHEEFANAVLEDGSE